MGQCYLMGNKWHPFVDDSYFYYVQHPSTSFLKRAKEILTIFLLNCKSNIDSSKFLRVDQFDTEIRAVSRAS